MIYDCIPFFNELDILRLRMRILAPYVDKFVLEEATVTFSGEPKEMVFDTHRDMFAEFADKIIYVPVDHARAGQIPEKSVDPRAGGLRAGGRHHLQRRGRDPESRYAARSACAF